MILGYDYKMWHEYKLKLPITLDISVYKHLIISGATNSGKSYALKYMMYGLSKEKCDIWYCDFKNEVSFITDKIHCFTGTDTIYALEKFYALYLDVKNKKTIINKTQILIMDEYPAFLLYLESKDKKLAGEIKLKVAEILMMGRSLNIGIWIAVQRPDASFFNSGAREQFMTSITLGRISPEVKKMLYAGETFPDRIYQVGEGVVLMDGMPLREVKIPKISNIPLMEKIIYENMS